MVPGMSLGALKIGQRSSSLSRTVQINRNRSRPGANLGAIWLQGRIFLDLGPFLVDFGTVFGWFLEGCSMNFETNFGRKFNDFSHMFGTISLTYSLMIPAWDPATPRSKHLRFSIIWGCAWGFKSAIYILFEKKKKGVDHNPRKQGNTSSILSLPLLCVRDVSWRTLKTLKEYQQRLFSSPYIYIEDCR